MSEEDQDHIVLGFLLAMLAGFTAGLSLMLFAFWVTAVPSVPWPEFARTHWGLHLGGVVECGNVARALCTFVGQQMSLFGDRFPIHLGPGGQRWITLKTDTERIGEQLGRAIAPMIDDLASIMYDCARGNSFGHMTEGRATAAMLETHLNIVRKDDAR